MTNLSDYLRDGAHRSARAVMCLLQDRIIDESWDADRKIYKADVRIARWENCREQGYVLSLRSPNYGRQLNIAFFEHRNSDNICAIKWEQVSINSLTIDTAQFGDVYKDKYDTSYSVSYDEHYKMSDWIWEELVKFWEETSNKKD